MNKKGLATIWIACIVFAAAIIAVGIFYYAHDAFAPALPEATNTTSTTQSIATPNSPPIATSTTTNPKPPVTASFSLSPTIGPIGTRITIHGAGFGTDNTITMNGLVNASMKGISSSDGKTLTFIMPDTLAPNCQPDQACPDFILKVTPNQYMVAVVTASTTQKIGTFTVTDN